MVAFYRLDHFHSINGHFLESNIGTFSSYNLAESCIDKLINKPGYNLYPRSNFVITKVILGNIHWEKGELVKAVIRSGSGGMCSIRYKDSMVNFDTKAGKSYSLIYDNSLFRILEN